MKHGGKGPVSVKKQIKVSIPGLAFQGQFEESDFRATASPWYKQAPGPGICLTTPLPPWRLKANC